MIQTSNFWQQNDNTNIDFKTWYMEWRKERRSCYPWGDLSMIQAFTPRSLSDVSLVLWITSSTCREEYERLHRIALNFITVSSRTVLGSMIAQHFNQHTTVLSKWFRNVTNFVWEYTIRHVWKPENGNVHKDGASAPGENEDISVAAAVVTTSVVLSVQDYAQLLVVVLLNHAGLPGTDKQRVMRGGWGGRVS